MNIWKKRQDEYIKSALKTAGKKKGKGKYRTNTFFHLAEEYRKVVTDEKEIEKEDRTELFWKELFSIIDEGELINQNITGIPTSGKSTVAMEEAWIISKYKFGKKFGIKDIDRDQQEYSRTITKSEITKTIRVIDEWNELEETGENSSVIDAFLNYTSDVMAQRFIHKISCSPSFEADKNASIYLHVISAEKRDEVTHCKLYYRLRGPDHNYNQLLGTISIYVGDVMREKWYKIYRQRKFEKMELITKEGIFRPRTLEYAEVIINVVNKLKPLAELTNLINPNIVRNYIKMECREKKLPQSIVGESLAEREVSGVLDLYKAYFKMSKEICGKHSLINKLKSKGEEIKVGTIQIELAKMNEIKNQLGVAIKLQEEELQGYKKIHQKYNENKEE